MKCLSGTVKETRFAWPEKKKTKMTETGYTVGTEGDVIHINGELDSGSDWIKRALKGIFNLSPDQVNIFHFGGGAGGSALSLLRNRNNALCSKSL